MFSAKPCPNGGGPHSDGSFFLKDAAWQKHSSINLHGAAILQLIHLSLRAANPSKLQEMLDCFELNFKTQNGSRPGPTRSAVSSNLQSSTAWIFRDELSLVACWAFNSRWETSKTWQPTAGQMDLLLGMWIIPSSEASTDESYLSIKRGCLGCSWRTQTWYSYSMTKKTETLSITHI